LSLGHNGKSKVVSESSNEVPLFGKAQEAKKRGTFHEWGGDIDLMGFGK